MKFQQMLDLVYANAEGVPVNELPCYQGAWDTLDSYTRGDIVVDGEIAWKAQQNVPARLTLTPAGAPDFWKPIRVLNAALLKTVDRLYMIRVDCEIYVSSQHLLGRLHRSYTAWSRLPLPDALSVINSYGDILIDAFEINSVNAVVGLVQELDDLENDSIYHAGGFIVENMPKNVEELKQACGVPRQIVCPMTHFLLANSVVFASENCSC